jgi:hypothetical protein
MRIIYGIYFLFYVNADLFGQFGFSLKLIAMPERETKFRTVNIQCWQRPLTAKVQGPAPPDYFFTIMVCPSPLTFSLIQVVFP